MGGTRHMWTQTIRYPALIFMSLSPIHYWLWTVFQPELWFLNASFYNLYAPCRQVSERESEVPTSAGLGNAGHNTGCVRMASAHFPVGRALAHQHSPKLHSIVKGFQMLGGGPESSGGSSK